MMTSKELAQLPGYSLLSEPELLFHPERPEDTSPHPLEGLLQYGPYSRALVNSVLDPIRVAAITPHGGLAATDRLLGELEQKHMPKERKQYLREFPGFSRVFGVRAVAASQSARIELPKGIDDELARAERPHVTLAEHLARAITTLSSRRNDFDVVLIYLPDKWQICFVGKEDDFDLHDYLKAVTAMAGIPCQVINDDQTGALSYFCRCSVMWRLGIALYCKVGGVPWRLTDVEPDTAFVGLGYTLRNSESSPRFVTCCSQVFDSDGAGLEFIAYSTDRFDMEGDNPYLDRATMQRVMARSLSLYQRRLPGRRLRHVVVHKSTPFRPEEVEGCFEAFRIAETIDLVQVQQDSPWRGVNIEAPRSKDRKKGQAGAYPCLRGTYLPISGREVLLWTQGDSPGPVGGTHYFQGGKGIPSPILLRRFAGHGGWDPTCRQVLGLTKMNWNSDNLYDRLPATLGYATTLATVLKRVSKLGDYPYQFRFFM